MKGDFTRDTFDLRNHFSRVLTQQGRVTLDADPNEQTSILLHLMRTQARDLIGPYGGPAQHGGFVLGGHQEGGLSIGPGRYYVDGILIENEYDDVTYLTQPDYTVPEDDALRAEFAEPSGQVFWVYLDVWERHLTPIEDDYMREKALGGPHTCTRAKVIWQVKARLAEKVGKGRSGTRTMLNNLRKKKAALEKERKETDDRRRMEKIDAELGMLEDGLGEGCAVPMADLVTVSNARLAARVDPGREYEDPCETSPDAKYRGTENHLYRIEIHRSGNAGRATFKWSRDNGSVATALLGTAGEDLLVADSKGFSAAGWVELTNDLRDLQGKPGALVKLAKVEAGVLTVDPDSLASPDALAWDKGWVNPKVRCWDQVQNEDIVLINGAVSVVEGSAAEQVWIDLEDGVQVQFAPEGEYRSGDYWLIPARVATGDIEWPEGNPVAMLPSQGILHHYAPLGFVAWRNGELEMTSCRCEFDGLAICESL